MRRSALSATADEAIRLAVMWLCTRSRDPSRIRKSTSAPVRLPYRSGYEPFETETSSSTSPLTIAIDPLSCTC